MGEFQAARHTRKTKAGFVVACERSRLSEESGESGLSSFSAMCSLFVALRKEARRRTHAKHLGIRPCSQKPAHPPPSLDCTHPGNTPNLPQSIQIHPNPVITNTEQCCPNDAPKPTPNAVLNWAFNWHCTSTIALL